MVFVLFLFLFFFYKSIYCHGPQKGHVTDDCAWQGRWGLKLHSSSAQTLVKEMQHDSFNKTGPDGFNSQEETAWNHHILQLDNGMEQEDSAT